MKKIFYLILSGFFIVLPQTVLAASNIKLPTTGETGLSDASVTNAIASVTRFVTGIIAVLAILMIVVSGIIYITSAGDSEKISQAKSWLTYAIVGLIIALLGYVIVIAVGQAVGAW